MNWRFCDGMYPLVSAPNWLLFVVLELLTFFVEGIILYMIGRSWLLASDTKKSMCWEDALFLSFCMNVLSAMLWVPVWLIVRGGF
jgi:hypothetical protein